jgi:hypothetical protein
LCILLNPPLSVAQVHIILLLSCICLTYFWINLYDLSVFLHCLSDGKPSSLVSHAVL